MSRLPGSPTRTMALVASSSPNLARPRITDQYEAMLLAADQARAACYASMEDLADQLETLAEHISASDVPIKFPDGTLREEDSLVTNLAAVRQTGDLAVEARAALAAAASDEPAPPRARRPPTRH